MWRRPQSKVLGHTQHVAAAQGVRGALPLGLASTVQPLSRPAAAQVSYSIDSEVKLIMLFTAAPKWRYWPHCLFVASGVVFVGSLAWQQQGWHRCSWQRLQQWQRCDARWGSGGCALAGRIRGRSGAEWWSSQPKQRSTWCKGELIYFKTCLRVDYYYSVWTFYKLRYDI